MKLIHNFENFPLNLLQMFGVGEVKMVESTDFANGHHIGLDFLDEQWNILEGKWP